MSTRAKQWTVSGVVFVGITVFALALASRCLQMQATNPEECIGARWGLLMLGLPCSLASAALFRGVGPVAVGVTGLLGAFQWGLLAFWLVGRLARLRSRIG